MCKSPQISCMLDKCRGQTFQQMMACSAETLYILLNISHRECQDPILIKLNCTCPRPLKNVMYIFKSIFKFTKTHSIGIYNYYKFDSWSFIKPTAFIVYVNVSFKLPRTSFLTFSIFYYIFYTYFQRNIFVK